MKFTIHTNQSDQPVGFVYADDEASALEIVRTTWNPIDPRAHVETPSNRRVAQLVSGATRFYARPVQEGPTNDDLKTVETDSEEFAELVETAWGNLMQGELLITETAGSYLDYELRELAGRMGSSTIENVLMTGDGVDQQGADNNPLPGNVVTVQEVARRVVAALAVMYYGGA